LGNYDGLELFLFEEAKAVGVNVGVDENRAAGHGSP
jgi:hypothetical protein